MRIQNEIMADSSRDIYRRLFLPEVRVSARRLPPPGIESEKSDVEVITGEYSQLNNVFRPALMTSGIFECFSHFNRVQTTIAEARALSGRDRFVLPKITIPAQRIGVRTEFQETHIQYPSHVLKLILSRYL